MTHADLCVHKHDKMNDESNLSNQHERNIDMATKTINTLTDE